MLDSLKTDHEPRDTLHEPRIMEAEQVIEKILGDAKAEAENIQQEAREKDAAEQAKFDEHLDEYARQTQALAEKAAKDEKSHVLAAARMEIAKDYLAEKIAILDEVFEKAAERLKNLPDDEYRALVTHLMLEAVETGDEEVIVDRQESRIDAAFIEHVNDKLAGGHQSNLRLSGERQDIGGGFILRRGKIKTNVSIDVLLDQAHKELEIELARELFSE